MRISPLSHNRQQVSSTSRWNLVQSASDSPGAQKKPLINRQTGQGSNLASLKRSLAKAEEHLAQSSAPGVNQNMSHGIALLKAQIARITGADQTGVDLNSVHDSPTGYVFAGIPDGGDTLSTAVSQSASEQSPISSFAQYQLWGTMRMRITGDDPPANATPGGSLKMETDPAKRSNVIRTPNNPQGSTFPTGVPGSHAGMRVEHDTRDDRGSQMYKPGFTFHHGSGNPPEGRGHVTSEITARGKHGQIKGGYKWQQSA